MTVELDNEFVLELVGVMKKWIRHERDSGIRNEIREWMETLDAAEEDSDT